MSPEARFVELAPVVVDRRWRRVRPPGRFRRNEVGRRRTVTCSVLLVVALVALAAACSADPGVDAGSSGTAGDGRGGVVRMLTHDSFDVSDSVLDEFTAQTGLTVEILRQGDAVAMVNKAILTKENPEGDVLFGIDSNTLSRALDEGVFVPHTSPGLDRVPDELRGDAEDRVTPIDHGDVCLNYDVEYFATAGLAPPTSLEDLTRPEYRGLLVVEDPASSTPGLAFVLASIASFGDGWTDFWSQLRTNDVLVVDGWEQAYFGAFSGGSGEGDRPIVVSYASSPPYEVANAEVPLDDAPTRVVDASCFRQVEYAGVLHNASNPAGAALLVDFLLSDAFQSDIPERMYVYPAVEGIALPDVFTRYASVPTAPLSLPPAEIGAHRDEWIDTWTTTVLR